MLLDRLTQAAWRLSQTSHQQLSILIFHRVLPQPDALIPDEPDAASFAKLMSHLARHVNFVHLPEAVPALFEARLPKRAVAITFDDGYADNHDVAAPILQRLGIPATIFVSTGFLQGDCMFNDLIIDAVRQAPAGSLDLRPLGLQVFDLKDTSSRIQTYSSLLQHAKYLELDERANWVQALRTYCQARPCPALMMQPDQVRALSRQGFEIGGHTVHHPILKSVSLETARAEIEQGRDDLCAITGRAPTLFAYPNGRPGVDYLPEHVQLVQQAGFSAAVATQHGVASPSSDRFQLPRFTPWDRDPARFSARLLAKRMGLA